MVISGTEFCEGQIDFCGEDTTRAGLMLSIIVHAHLVAVFFRSHGNPAIFRLHRFRFLVVPALLWAFIASSVWIAVASTVVATMWDVWHSGAQSFGFARIYDRNRGNPVDACRRLDYWLNQLLYAGPILAGVTLLDHFHSLEGFEEIGTTVFAGVPPYLAERQSYLTWAVLIGGTAFVGYYCAAYWRLSRRGYRFPFHKVFLLTSTGLCSIYTWGFNSFGDAFFIMNLFHAVQYLALVWASEKKRIIARFRLPDTRAGQQVALGLYLGLVGLYGFWVQLVDPKVEVLWAITMVVSLMHFWYDGFIWSVRRAQV
jgi:hypothetical protein